MNRPVDIGETVKRFKALADASRLKILSALMESPKYVEIIAERLDLTPSTVSFHLKKLEAAGLVQKHKEQYYIVYSVVPGVLDAPVSKWIPTEHSTTDDEEARESAYKEKVLKSFFKYDQLKSIPVQQKKRLIVLERIVQSFEFNCSYTEKEVNLIIAAYHDDFATLRKALVEAKLMSRCDGLYKRLH
ncbi:DUF2087 domain-containing protein [Fusibacter sp. JL298sf-3]